MSTATVKPTTVRIEEGLKEQATEFLDSVGLGLPIPISILPFGSW